jgi:alpha,alpha-trehalose phosphorylase
MVYRGRRLRVSVAGAQAHYELLAGEPLTVEHHGEPVKLAVVGEPVTRALQPARVRARPAQPHGRRPPLGHAKR